MVSTAKPHRVTPGSGEDRDEIPWVQEEVEIEAVAVEGQDESEGDRQLDAPSDPVEYPTTSFEPKDDLYASITNKTEIKWHHYPFSSVSTAWECPFSHTSAPLKPLEYFNKYVLDEMFELMAEMTNLYA
ncbi:UNVERIFIED_CONTAM: hypothetical protein FKN15_028094 [Acipenser sinensis]